MYTELKKAEGETVQFALPKLTLEAPVLVKPAYGTALEGCGKRPVVSCPPVAPVAPLFVQGSQERARGLGGQGSATGSA